MDDTTPAGCYKLGPRNTHGDIDENGDIVDSLFARLPAERATRLQEAMSPDIADDFNAREQLELVALFIERRSS